MGFVFLAILASGAWMILQFVYLFVRLLIDGDL
jgi:hypothetical protein